MVIGRKFLHKILDFIYPPICPLCNEQVSQHGELCADCWTAINWIDGPHCARCGYPFVAGYDFDKEILFTPRAKKVLERAWLSAKKANKQKIEASDLLLAILDEPNSVAMKALDQLGVDAVEIRYGLNK